MKGPHGFLMIHISPERPRLCSVPVPSSTAQREHDRSHIQQSLKTHLVLFKSDRLTLVSRCDDVRLSGGGDSQQIPPTHTRSDVLPEGSKYGAVRAGPGLHQGGSRGTAGRRRASSLWSRRPTTGRATRACGYVPRWT